LASLAANRGQPRQREATSTSPNALKDFEFMRLMVEGLHRMHADRTTASGGAELIMGNAFHRSAHGRDLSQSRRQIESSISAD
jgi:hypothetical protein